MKVHTEEEKRQYEVEKTHKIILSNEEYENWKKIWLDTLGWGHEFPHTTSLHKIFCEEIINGMHSQMLNLKLRQKDMKIKVNVKLEIPMQGKIECS